MAIKISTKLKIIFFCLVVLSSKSFLGQSIPKWKIPQLQKIQNQQDTIVVINFWSTYCAPCIKEMPDLLAIKDTYKNKKVKFYFVSLDFKEDYPKRIKTFIQKKKWKGNYVWLNETNADLFCPVIDASWGGSIPATLVIQQSSGNKKFWEGEITKDELTQTIENFLKANTN